MKFIKVTNWLIYIKSQHLSRQKADQQGTPQTGGIRCHFQALRARVASSLYCSQILSTPAHLCLE